MEFHDNTHDNISEQMKQEQAPAQTPGQAVVIDRDGFDRIVAECVDEMLHDPKMQETNPMALLLFPMMGMHFASQIRQKLFGTLKT